MDYKVKFTKRVKKDIKKLDSVTKSKVGKAIIKYTQDPLHFAKKLTSNDIGDYRWRAGNYRIIFDLKGKTIEVLKIGHRRDVYKD